MFSAKVRPYFQISPYLLKASAVLTNEVESSRKLALCYPNEIKYSESSDFGNDSRSYSRMKF